MPGMSIYHMVTLKANIDSHYFKRLQTLVFCNNLHCLIRNMRETSPFRPLTNTDLNGRALGQGKGLGLSGQVASQYQAPFSLNY